MSDEHHPTKGRPPAPFVRPWPLLESEVLHSFPIYDLRRDRRRSPRTGKVHEFLVLDSMDWVNVVPVTPEGRIVMIRQFRHGTASPVWEIPGGMMDPGDETALEAARRELVEETGYEPEAMRFLGAVHPNPAIQNNLCLTFLAERARLRRAQRLDTSEDIRVQEVPWPEVRRMIDEGEISHSLVLNAIFWYERYLEGRPPPPLPARPLRGSAE